MTAIPALPAAASALPGIAQDLEARTPQEILGWALETYRPRITLACSFGGPTGMALLDMALRLDPELPVFFLDTGLLFPETYALAAQVRERYGIAPRAIQPVLSLAEQERQYGPTLWSRDPDACCALRKVAPQRAALAGFDAWITGLRRDQSAGRGATPVIQWDARFGLAKISPLAAWSEEQVWAYIRANDVPVNALHGQGYPSLGCTHCTRAVAAGEDARAGRWSTFAKTECGLHWGGEKGGRA